MKTILFGHNMNVMTQSMKGIDGPRFPHGLSVANTYTKVTSGEQASCGSSENLMAIPVTITEGFKVTQVVAANVVWKCYFEL